MSAFVVSILHIDTIVTAARQFEVQAFDQASADALGRDLIWENAKSVVYRYHLETSEQATHYEALAAGYRHTPGRKHSVV